MPPVNITLKMEKEDNFLENGKANNFNLYLPHPIELLNF